VLKKQPIVVCRNEHILTKCIGPIYLYVDSIFITCNCCGVLNDLTVQKYFWNCERCQFDLCANCFNGVAGRVKKFQKLLPERDAYKELDFQVFFKNGLDDWAHFFHSIGPEYQMWLKKMQVFLIDVLMKLLNDAFDTIWSKGYYL